MDKTEELNIQGADIALKIEQLLKELTTCIREETSALKAHDKKTSAKKLKEKQDLLQRYKALHEEVSVNSDSVNIADPNIKSYLKNVIGDFEGALRENTITIHTGKVAVTRLLSRILEKARETMRQENTHYDSTGQLVAKNHQTFSATSRINETL